ncbi:MAG: alginate lyase family protein, partial [Saprospiraceae bacterium]
MYKYLFIILVIIISCKSPNTVDSTVKPTLFSEQAIIEEANRYLEKEPITVTSTICERSAGTPNDFYSEGDYWWLNPADPDGPYMRKDGQTNPENFIAHRLAMRDLSRWVASLTAAYKITKDKKY